MRFRAIAAAFLAVCLLTLSAVAAQGGKTGFKDVGADAFYYNAVYWAAENGIASGTGADAFGPDLPCTRAQIVTFLWRAAGSPRAGSAASFSDIPGDAYYREAVSWAVKTGVAAGTGGSTFGPDDVCSRAQAVSFLWRAMGSPKADLSNPFRDVGAEEYYYVSVLWAFENNIAAGTGTSSFSPDRACTRGQIITFLYRCYASPAQEEDESWKLILVNAQHPLPEGFSVKLKQLRNGQAVDERIYPELQRMFDDARAAGIYPLINESFRSAERQQEIMDKYIARYRAQGMSEEEAEQAARLVVALPGTSEHQLGLALDIIAEFSSDSTATWEWLRENCWKYGFILRYPADKVEITGFSYEPWHFRYVGTDAAKEIMEKGLALEEYLGAA